MKRLIPLLCAVLLLTGCAGMYPEEYLYADSHVAPFAYQETTSLVPTDTEEQETALQTVSYLSDIRTGIQEMIRTGKTSGRFLLRDYRGETETLAETVRTDLETYSPKYVYKAELTLVTETTDEGVILSVKIKPGLKGSELETVASRLYSNALPRIYEALTAYQSSFMIEITGYVETDFIGLLDEYALNHPDEVIEMPTVRVEVTPDTGSVRFVVLRFQYQNDTETLLRQQEIVKSLLNGYQNMFSVFDEPQTLLDTMYKLLVPARGYTNHEDATVYSLLLSKEGSSRMMASVAAFLCKRAGSDCKIVRGERNGETWYWNQLNTGTRSLYFDLHAAALSGSAPALLTAEEMTGYTWDPERYPEVTPPAPAEPEPEETEPTEASTEAPTETP